MNDANLAPAAFIGHGNPMNTLEDNRYTRAWSEFGRSCGTPRAVLAISAHWYTNATAVTAMERPRTIHDFYGFPQELSEFEYPAPGSPQLAEEIAEAVLPDRIGLDADSWGLDHGTWSVLAHAFPAANVPVVQLSINALKPVDYHFELARRLAPLRSTGVVVVASGNVVHNLRAIDWHSPEAGFDWAQRFDERARQVLTESPAEVAALAEDPDFRMAAPTPDHFLPLVYLAGLADATGCAVRTLVDGYAYGSVSMAAYALGAPSVVQSLDDPTELTAAVMRPETPADQTNL